MSALTVLTVNSQAWLVVVKEFVPESVTRCVTFDGNNGRIARRTVADSH